MTNRAISLISLAFAFLLVGTPAKECYTKTVTVCPTKHHKKIPPKPVFEFVPLEVSVPVPYPVLVPGPVRTVLQCPGCPPEPPVVVGGFAGVALGVQDPYVSGEIGVRMEIPKVYLGIQAFSVLQYGVGVQLLPYVYRGRTVQVHIIDPGALITGKPFSLLSDQDIPRGVDLLVGAGVQVKLTCHLSLIADVRTSIPDPGRLGSKDCVNNAGRRVDSAAAVGNAFSETQLLLGLYLHD